MTDLEKIELAIRRTASTLHSTWGNDWSINDDIAEALNRLADEIARIIKAYND